MRNYKLALEVLERRELNSGVWDAVIWEYTCVLFTLASLLQDYAPLSIKVTDNSLTVNYLFERNFNKLVLGSRERRWKTISKLYWKPVSSSAKAIHRYLANRCINIVQLLVTTV